MVDSVFSLLLKNIFPVSFILVNFHFYFTTFQNITRGENQKGVRDISPTLQESQN